MDESMQTYLDHQRTKLFHDCKYRAKNETWLNRAYAMMLVDQGFLSKEEYRTIDKGLVQVLNTVTEEDMKNASNGQDIFFLYEKALYDAIGMDTACKLHVGRSRNDIYFTEYRMSVREAIFFLMEEVIATQKALEKHAQENMETVIPYYTYGQPAQPGTWGHYLMGIHLCLEHDLSRMRHAYENTNQCPMGAGAGIGSAFKLNKYRLAQLLGFDGTIENTLMANSSADYFLELEASVTILNTTLERVGNDLDFFASMECGILDGDSSICGGSSIMPQKKNYTPGAHLREMAHPFYGHFIRSIMTAGSVSLFPVHETFSFFSDFMENVEGVVGNLKMLRLALDHSHIRKDVALTRARDGFTAATHMAEQLTMEVGEPFVKTHHIVGNMIHQLMDEDRLAVENMTSELMKPASVKAVGFEVERTDEQIAEMLDPLASLNAKVTGGTPKPEDTRKLLEAGQKIRQDNEAWLAASRKKVSDAFAAVEKGLD